MVTFNDWAIHFTDALGAFVRVRVVTDDVAETNKIRALIFAGIGKHGLERFEIGHKRLVR